MNALSLFRGRLRSWFEEAYPAPTRVQGENWPVLASGRNALLIAPTGSGKTLAALLPATRIGSRPKGTKNRGRRDDPACGTG